MLNRAVFTLSLDCEGLWGMADQPAVLSAGRISQAALHGAYHSIRQTLEQEGLLATAAFVSCFAADPEAVRQQMALLDRLAALVPGWFLHLLPMLKAGKTDGWDGSSLYSALKSSGHEMAWHGTTHMPLTDVTSADAVELELQLAQALWADLGAVPESIVFPRNKGGHFDLLHAAGFKTYRASPPPGVVGRIGSLAHEWNMWDNRVNVKPCIHDGWNVSPAGFFLNWPSGVRAMVPPSVTVRRWTSLLRHAVDTGGYVHMWFHPHNLITAPAMATVFQQIMSEVGCLVRSGDMQCLTMSQASATFLNTGA